MGGVMDGSQGDLSGLVEGRAKGVVKGGAVDASQDASRPVLGLIAGEGVLPIEIARAVRARGERVVAVAMHGVTNPELKAEVDDLAWLHVGEVEQLIEIFLSAGVRRAVMAGKVAKTHLVQPGETLHLDGLAIQLLQSLPDRRDDSLLRALADLLAERGVTLCSQAEWVPCLQPGAGRLGRIEPTVEQWADIEFAWPIAKELARRDIGQSLAVQGGCVLALEAIEGTDAMIRRAGAQAGPGLVVLKVAKPGQDPRFDVPTIGPRTLEAAAEAGASLLAFEAPATLVLRGPEMARRADDLGIALVGVAAGCMPRERAGDS